MTDKFSRLMVIVPHSLTGLIEKGEITDRYYNPGDLFSEVHIVLTNEDKPCRQAVQRMVGSANLFLHNCPTGLRFFIRTLGWRPWLVSKWSTSVVKLAESIKPQLVRCHGAYFNAIAARNIKRKFNIPYVVSLHTNPDQHLGVSLPDRIQWFFMDSMAGSALREADMVLPVYQGILPYLKRLRIKNIEVAYNVVNPTSIIRKTEYTIGKPIRVITVGRHIEGKSPENIIRAAALNPGIRLTVVGDGVLNRQLRDVAEKCGLRDRVEFMPSVENDELCRRLSEHDIFAICNQKWGISKTVLEAFLTGMPVLINKQNSTTVPEITSDITHQVENTPEGYCRGMQWLIEDETRRKELGRNAMHFAMKTWAPDKTEEKFVRIYQNLLNVKN